MADSFDLDAGASGGGPDFYTLMEMQRAKEHRAQNQKRGGVNRPRGGSVPVGVDGKNTTETLKALIGAGLVGPALGILAQFPGARDPNHQSPSNTLQEQAIRAMDSSKMVPDAIQTKKPNPRGPRGGGGLGGGAMKPMGYQAPAGPMNDYRQRQQVMKDREQAEKERRAALEFEMRLRLGEQQQKMQLIQQLIGGLPKTIESTQQQLTPVAGSWINRTTRSTQQRDYTPLIASFF